MTAMSCACSNPLFGFRASLLLAACLALAISASPVPAQTQQDPWVIVLRAIAEAEDALQRNEPQLAESRYRTALQEGWMLLGALEVTENNLEAARSAYEAAAASAVETRLAKLSIATIDIKAGHPDKAISPLRLIISMNSLDHQARNLLARALATNGQVAESIQELEELRILFPQDLENLYTLAAAYLNHEDLEKAEPLLNELAVQRPIPQTHVLIGRTYRDFDHWDHARRSLGKALEMDPQVRRAHFYLGTVEIFERGHQGLKEAQAHFEIELQLAPGDPMSSTYLGMALVEDRREEEAIPYLEAASRHPVTERQASHYLGLAYLRVGRATEAVDYLRQSLELTTLSPDDSFKDLYDRRISQIAQIHYQLGLAFRQTGDQEQAAVHFRAAEEFRESQTQDSRERLQRFLEDEPQDQTQDELVSPLESTAVAHLDPQGRRELRGDLATRLAQVYLNLGVMQTRAKHVARAGDLFARAAELDPGFPQVQYALGVARFNSGQFDLATEPLTRALERDPANAEIRRMLALAWLNSDHYASAVELLKNDQERKSNRSLQYAYGIALVRSGRAIEAQRIFADLLIKYPDWAELSVVLGQAYAQQDEYGKAVESLEKAIALDPDVAEAHLTMGEIYLRQGELEASEKELRAELVAHPQDLRAQQLLAMVLDLAGKSEEALELLRALLDKRPQSADARYLMGKILLAEGDAERAQIQLESAARLAPDDPEAHYQLGLALQRLGRPEEAKREFETFQALKRSKNSGGSQ